MREAILRRRRQFVAAALTALAAGSAQAQEAGADASPDAQTSLDAGDGEPQACLCACEAPGHDAGTDGLLPIAAALTVVALGRRASRKRRADAPNASQTTEES